MAAYAYSSSSSCLFLTVYLTSECRSNYPVTRAMDALQHEPAVKQDLKSRWVVAVQSPAYAPLDDIRDYFGEKIALYFQFMAHMSKWMLPLAVLGLIVYAVTMGTHDIEHPIAIAFALFVVIW
jgi:Calcium-activated chloride channel